MGFLHGIARGAQVIEFQLDTRVIDHPLENLAIHLEKGSSKRFGLVHHLTDRLLKQTRLYRALDSHEYAQLPLRTRVTRLLREPNV